MQAAGTWVTVLLAAAVRAQEAGPTGPVRDAFARASWIEAIHYSDVVYGRFGASWPNAGWRDKPGLVPLAELCARRDGTAELLPLLADADPRVRTLALLVLFDRQEPRALPRLAALCTDGSAAIPDAQANHVFELTQPRWSVRATTVGAVASLCVGMYLEAAGVRLTAPVGELFAGYWDAREDREHCAGWLAVALLRAHGGVVPVHEGGAERIRAVRKRVLALRSPERELLLIALPRASGIEGSLDAFATGAERLAAARALSDDGLLAALGGAFGADDPDLPSVCGLQPSRFGGRGLQAFVLAHARAIFAPSSAPKLLAFERSLRERGFDAAAIDVGWVTAAASLQPEHAEEWLRAAWDRFTAPFDTQSRALILVAMYDCAGAAAEPWIADRFWELEEAVFSHPPRAEFVRHLREAGAAEDGAARSRARRTMRALVEHAGFAGCDPLTLIAIARTANHWNGGFVVDERELSALQHPLGLHSLLTRAKMERAKAQYPGETGRCLETMAAWRGRIAGALAEMVDR